MNINREFIYFIIFILILDLILRILNVQFKKIRIFEIICLFGLLIYILIKLDNVKLIGTVLTLIVSLSIALKDLLNNFISTILLILYPEFEENDIIKLPDRDEEYTFKGINFLRSNVVSTDGSILKIPNKDLLNSELYIK